MRVTKLLLLSLLLFAAPSFAQTFVPNGSENFSTGPQETILYDGGNWQTYPGAPPNQVTGGFAEAPNANQWTASEWVGNQFPPNQAFAVTVAKMTDASSLIALFIDLDTTGSHNYYQMLLHGPTGTSQTHQLYKYINGTPTLLGSFTATIQPGDFWQISDYNNYVEAWQNGVDKLAVHDTALTGGTVGFGMYSPTVANEQISQATGYMIVTPQNADCGQAIAASLNSPASSPTPVYPLENAGINWDGANTATFEVENWLGAPAPVVGEQVSIRGIATNALLPLNRNWTITKVTFRNPGYLLDVAVPSPGFTTATLQSPGSSATISLGVQTVTADSVSGGVATVYVVNSFKNATHMTLHSTANGGGALNGDHLLTAVTSTYVQFSTTASAFAKTNENADALAVGEIDLQLVAIFISQAQGNFQVCVGNNQFTSVIQHTPTNGSQTQHSSSPYTPGTYNTYQSAFVDINECFGDFLDATCDSEDQIGDQIIFPTLFYSLPLNVHFVTAWTKVSVPNYDLNPDVSVSLLGLEEDSWAQFQNCDNWPFVLFKPPALTLGRLNPVGHIINRPEPNMWTIGECGSLFGCCWDCLELFDFPSFNASPDICTSDSIE
jgi:hypothetical protein